MMYKAKILYSVIFVMVFVSISQAAYCQKEKTRVREGNRDFKKGNFESAEIKYRKALEEKPLMNEAEFNLGNALYMQENYQEAALSYMASAQRTEDNKLKALSFYNLGNSLYNSEMYGEAVEAYKESLRSNPTDEARYNLEMAKKMLAQSEQEQQGEGENQDSDENQEQQESESQEQQGDDKQDKQGEQQQSEQSQQQEGNEQEAQQIEISEEDAERILEALKNEEQETMSKILEQKHKGDKSKIDKDW